MPTEPRGGKDNADKLPTSAASGRFQPLRIWPPVVLLTCMVVSRLLPSLISNGPANLWMSAAFGPSLCGILIVLWWLVASRATRRERIGGMVGIIVAVVATFLLVDKSMIGPGTMAITIPLGTAGFALGGILCWRILSFRRTIVALLLAVCGFGFSTLLRCDGLWGDFSLGIHWRWQPSPEDRLLANQEKPTPITLSSLAGTDIDQGIANPAWPGFRGSDRTGRQRGSQIASDWTANPPEQLWKIPVGPAWSSFAVAGPLLFTQEQRGPRETVVCYDANSGREVWTQQVEARFDDPLGGPGPRATPTLAQGGLFVLGAKGLLMRLDPKTGGVVWRQDLQQVANRKPPTWGFTSSPLVVNSSVIVYAGGEGDKGTLAFSIETGDLQWSAPAGDHSYSSPQLCTIAGEELVLMLTNQGIDLLDPESGAERLNYEWKHQNYRALQPQVFAGNTILLPTGMGAGTRRILVSKEGARLSAEELWTSRHLKSDYNDFVIYQDHAYGFDGTIFTCLDLETGNREWKGGRYGKGQVLLLEDSRLLLVASELGNVILVKPDPSAHTELAKIKAIEGKTWNHPVVIGDRLYIRNAQEAACFRLPTATAADVPAL